jgi:fatty-acid desaturase
VTDELPPKDPGSEILVRAGGLVVACWGAVLLAAIGAFFTPFRIGSVLVPISVVLVVLGLVGLTQFAHDVTGHTWLSLVPGLIWLLISFWWSSRTSEGDLVLVEQNWVATVYLFAGAITIGVAAYRIIVPPRRRGL